MKKSNWIIVVLVAVLALAYWFSRENQVSVGIKKLSLPNFVVEKVDRIEVQGKEPIKLIKDKDEWFLEITSNGENRRVKADANHVKSLLDAALLIKHAHYVTNLKDKYKDLGLLGDESVTVTIFADNNPVWALTLGKNDQGSGKYAKLPDQDDVFVVRGSFWSLTRNGAIDFRDRDIMPIKEGEATTFKVTKSGLVTLALKKDPDSNHWSPDSAVMKIPEGFRVNQESLASLVRTVLTINALGFVDEKRDLGKPVLSVDVAGGNQHYTLNLYSGGGETYLVQRTDDSQIYEINKFMVAKIDKSLDELRDLSVLRFDKTSIVKVSVKGARDPVVVQKEEGQWKIISPAHLPKDFEFDPNTVDDMLSMLHALEGVRLARKLKDLGQNNGWEKNWIVELADSNNQLVHLYASKNKANKDEYVVLGNIDQEAYVVNSLRLASLFSGVKAFKKEEFDLPPIDENTRGFESLPVDVQRKLLDATKKKQQ